MTHRPSVGERMALPPKPQAHKKYRRARILMRAADKRKNSTEPNRTVNLTSDNRPDKDPRFTGDLSGLFYSCDCCRKLNLDNFIVW